MCPAPHHELGRTSGSNSRPCSILKSTRTGKARSPPRAGTSPIGMGGWKRRRAEKIVAVNVAEGSRRQAVTRELRDQDQHFGALRVVIIWPMLGRDAMNILRRIYILRKRVQHTNTSSMSCGLGPRDTSPFYRHLQGARWLTRGDVSAPGAQRPEPDALDIVVSIVDCKDIQTAGRDGEGQFFYETYTSSPIKIPPAAR